MSDNVGEAIESRLAGWRSFVSERTESDKVRLDALEHRLRATASELASTGLDADEAFLIALMRASEADPSLRAFARQYADGLLAVSADAEAAVPAESTASVGLLVALACAVGAAVAIKIPALFGYEIGAGDSSFYELNISLFVVPFLLVFFAWRHRPPRGHVIAVAAVLAVGAVCANAYPFVAGGQTLQLTALHLPILLWLAVGVAYAGGSWLVSSKRMQFVRFTGEWFVTYVLIALGGGVLTAITIGLFEAIGVSAETFMTEWALPCGAMGAVLVAAWLVETRRNLVGGLAPMLARVFTPLFAIMLVALLVGVVWSRGFIGVEREVLILFDLLLVLVLAMLLYAISSRDPHVGPGLFDRVQLVLVGCALAVDLYALASIAIRLGQYGFTANKTAALGLNLILLVNLAWSAYLQGGFVRGRRKFSEVENWQMRYLPVYAIWAAVVVIAFPLIFGFA